MQLQEEMNIDIRYDSPEHKISVQDIFSCDKYSMNYAQDACRNASRSLCKTSFSKGRGKAIPLQAWTGPEGSRRMRLLDFKTVEHKGSKVVSPTHWLPLPPRNIPGTHFCYRLSQPQGHSAAGRIVSIKNSNDTIGNLTRNLLVRSAVPQNTVGLIFMVTSIRP